MKAATSSIATRGRRAKLDMAKAAFTIFLACILAFYGLPASGLAYAQEAAAEAKATETIEVEAASAPEPADEPAAEPEVAPEPEVSSEPEPAAEPEVAPEPEPEPAASDEPAEKAAPVDESAAGEAASEQPVATEEKAAEKESAEPVALDEVSSVEAVTAKSEKVNSELTLKAAAATTYTITWVNDDGTVLATSEVEKNTKPVYEGETPTKEADENYVYTFSGWTPTITRATADKTYTAKYSKKQLFTVTWLDDDGTVLEEDAGVIWGSQAEYNGEVPTKEEDAFYSYEFQYWTLEGKDKEVTNFTVASNKRYVASYKKTIKEYKVTVKAVDIYYADGGKIKVEEKSLSNMVSKNTTWRISLKTLQSMVSTNTSGKIDFDSYGKRYVYSGLWEDEKGNAFEPITLGGSTGIEVTEDTVLTFRPVYVQTPIWWLNYYYVDNVSTGSGSWRNVDSLFSGYSHTFSDPSVKTPVSHYKFVDWLNTDDNKAYAAGDVYNYPSTYMTPGTTKEVLVNARWQPSVTVNYFNWNGESLNSKEAFDKVDVYASGEREAIEGADFLGWYDADGNKIEEGTVYAAPEVTTEPNQEKVVDVYARYSTSYTVQHAKQNVDDDEYTVDEDATETIEGALLGSSVKADPKTFEGFTYKSEVEGTVAQAVINEDFIKTFLETGIALKLFYNRNVHSVTYAYDGYVPADATDLPASADYKYGAAVKVAADATATGYRFSGWDRADFDMPDEDVVVTGSFEAIPYTVTYVYDGTVPAGASALPKAATYTYGDTVDVAAAATASGYTFSGWDRTGSFAMPAQDVVIHGSFTAIPPAPTPTPDPTPTPRPMTARSTPAPPTCRP